MELSSTAPRSAYTLKPTCSGMTGTPQVRLGAGGPDRRGRRITVQNIAIWHERIGLSAEQIASDYDLTLAQVYAALATYVEHRAEIDQAIRDGQALAEAMRQATPALVKAKLHGQ